MMDSIKYDYIINWVDEIPAHWEFVKTKYLFKLVTEKAPENNSMELLSLYTDIGVRPRKELEEKGNKASTTDSYWMVRKGDIIVNKLLAWMGAIGISEYDGVTSPAYDILRRKTQLNPYYYNFLFRSGILNDEFRRRSRGIMDMRLRLYFEEFGQIHLPYPPIEEQDKIVDYLNKKSNLIELFISKKKLLIDLLNEEKTALINHVVTKGIDDTVPMKPSGVEWLGDIPAHWEVKKLKYVAALKSGDSITSDQINPEGKYPVFGGNGLRGFFSSFTHEGNFVLIGRQGALCGNVNYGSGKFWASEHAVVCTIKDGSNFIWFGELLRTMNLNQYSQSAAQPGISVEVISNLHIAVPPTLEQAQIVSKIQNEVFRITRTISKIEKEIELLTEYKTSLIYEVVTGKVKVDALVEEPVEATL